MDANFIALISAATALIASIAGPSVQLMIARRQINANVISVSRQKWIETLRDHTAEFTALLSASAVFKLARKGDVLDEIANNLPLLEKVQRIVLVQYKIRLLINPTEADHRDFMAAVDSALKRVQTDVELDITALTADIEAVTLRAQAILKHEWVRVKRGD